MGIYPQATRIVLGRLLRAVTVAENLVLGVKVYDPLQLRVRSSQRASIHSLARSEGVYISETDWLNRTSPWQPFSMTAKTLAYRVCVAHAEHNPIGAGFQETAQVVRVGGASKDGELDG